ncbi:MULTISPECIES: hypothetical protein [unclassified Streptomyces]|uniref:hypothetical protein n=1 Tax=unclassified Streptomyces TaxID=2593676 RepID=UPI0011614F9F|nr:hypothetical protein [Streptomyces sp. CB02058]
MTFEKDAWYGPQGHEPRLDLTSVSSRDLRWYCFLGAWRIEHGTTDISPPWGWTPLFDAFYTVLYVMEFARTGTERVQVGFTENDERIRLKHRGDDLVLSPTYTQAEITCPTAEFTDAGRDFIQRELGGLVARHPALALNPVVRQLTDEAGLTLAGGTERPGP